MVMKTPAECRTMADIRAEIDRVDEELVRQFAARAGYIDRAGEIKAEIGLPARIGSRVEEVGGQCAAACRGHGPAAGTGRKAVASADRLVDCARGVGAGTRQPARGQMN